MAAVRLIVLGLVLFCTSRASAKDPPAATPAAVNHEAVPAVSEWKNPDAFQAASAAAVAAQIGKFDECVEKDKASIELEDRPSTRLHLSLCEMRTKQLLDALGNAQKVLKAANEQHDAALADFARRRSADILPRIAHIAFFIPAGVEDLKLTFDGKEVPTESVAGKKFAVDPGEHNIHAEGAANGVALTFDKTYDLSEGEFITAAIALVPKEPEYLSTGQLNCVLTARTQKEVFKCLPQGGANLVVHAGLEISAYSDTDHVEVIAPRLSASVVSPTAGWNVAATYLIDVVSAASPDIVSEASPPFHEMRHAVTLSGGYKPGRIGANVDGHVSDEPDYLSIGGGVALTTDLNDKLITPTLSYDFTNDTIGRGGEGLGMGATPFSVFSHTFQTHDIDASVTLILDAHTLLALGAGVELERGDQSKPYRYIPMFSPTVAPLIPAGASIGLVNTDRLSARPLEQLPLARDRFSVGARFAHRFKGSTLRIDQRLYRDTWEQQATTTDARFLVDVGKNLLVWPHGRFNLQNGADFYKLAYSAPISVDQTSILLPAFRSDDRELSPLWSVTLGGGGRYELGDEDSSVHYAITLQADVLYDQYSDALFITSRTGVYGTLGFEAELQ